DLESSILARVTGDGHGFGFLRHPSGDALADLDRYFPDQTGMRILGRPQNEKILRAVEQVKQAGIAFRDLDHEVDDLPQHFVQIQRAADGVADLMENSQLKPRKIKGFLYVFE